MKTLYKITLILLLPVLFLGCEDMLEKKPQGQPDIENYYKAEVTYVEAINAMYASLRHGYINGTHRPGIKGDNMSDDVVLGTTPNQTVVNHHNFNINATQPNIGPWEGLYQLIALTNIFLERVTDNQDKRSLSARGEVFFLRGWAYHNLARWYGGAIIYTSNAGRAEDYNKALNSNEEVWQQAVSDFTEAAKRLPAKWANPAVDLGRATKGAAYSYLARAMLYRKDYQKVLAYVDSVKQLGVYRLVNTYAENFTHAGENNAESIFEVQYGVNFSPYGWQGTQHNLLQMYGPKGVSLKLGFVGNAMQGAYQPSEDLVAKYEMKDTRRKAMFIFPGDTITLDGQSLVAPTALATFKSQWSSTGVSLKKWLAPPSTCMNNNAWQSTLNWKLMRYAEVLLMEAEAATELNQTDRALTALNQVRVRAGIGELNAAGLTQAWLRDEVRLEYRRELAFEALRFFNLMRWDIVPEALTKRGFTRNKHEYHPIPQSEIDRNNKLTQYLDGWK